MKLAQKNIRIFLDAQELNEYEYEYLNIFKCTRVDRMIIQIYSDAQEFIEQISKYMRTEAPPGI